MQLETLIADHYGQTSPIKAFHSALRNAKADLDHLTLTDLMPFEDMHIGGRQATADLAAHLRLEPGMQVLDIGSGVGGSARFLAQNCGCTVCGIDLTADFVALASDLTRRVGLGHSASFQQGSALQLPFPAERFDRAYMIHVGMNISSKATVFTEAQRVLKPGGLMAVYDAMRLSDAAFPFPMPWAASEETSFVETILFYREALEKAGFAIETERDLWALGVAGSPAAREHGRAGADAPPGPHIFMGERAAQKLSNVFAAMQSRVIAPIQIVASKL